MWLHLKDGAEIVVSYKCDCTLRMEQRSSFTPCRILWYTPSGSISLQWLVATCPHTLLWQGCNFNSLGPSDAIRQQRSGSTLAQVMACCLTAPSHYLNQCWLISKPSDIYLKASSQEVTQPSITEIIWKIKYLKFHSNFPGANELTAVMAQEAAWGWPAATQWSQNKMGAL